VAIKEWSGAVVSNSYPKLIKILTPTITQVIISHNHEFVSSLCKSLVHRYAWHYSHAVHTGPEIWNVEDGRIVQQGKSAVVEDTLDTPRGSGKNTPVRSRLQSPAASTAATPVGSGAEDASGVKLVMKKKKKPTRNQLKAQEERRRLRKLRWLNEGGPKPEDTDSETEPS
jgi:elongation factor 3